ncbi:hypothetical protein, partial [Paraburkholderia ginsengiterrae]|uniref:hypothetical protein n=1 Tax=Paraburkholderia ginsengiterrae TaxID=1462993 RepID=UPI001ABFBD13
DGLVGEVRRGAMVVVCDGWVRRVGMLQRGGGIHRAVDLGVVEHVRRCVEGELGLVALGDGELVLRVAPAVPMLDQFVEDVGDGVDLGDGRAQIVTR